MDVITYLAAGVIAIITGYLLGNYVRGKLFDKKDEDEES